MIVDREDLKDLKNIIEELYSFGEIVAGSKNERLLVDFLLEMIRESVGVSAWVEPIVVASWSDKGSYVEGCNRRVRAVAWPQTLGGRVEARIAILEPRLDASYWSRQEIEDSIVLVELPEDPDDASTIYMHAVERGALGVVFFDKWFSRYRRIVVTGSWGYSFNDIALGPIPAVHIRREDGLWFASRCGGEKIVVESGSAFRWSTGSIVMSSVGEGDEEVWITCHHDHWLGGANDNLAGVALGFLLFKKLASETLKRRVVYASFSAEEFGCPGLTSWYWACGSRYFVDQLEAINKLENIVSVINFDSPGSERLLVYASGFESHPLILRASREIDVKIDGLFLETSYSDGYSFSRKGVTSITFMNISDYIDKYHTDLDEPGSLDYNTLEKTLALGIVIAKKLVDDGFRALDYNYYAESVFNYVQRLPAPPPVQAAAYKLLQETRRAVEESDFDSVVKAYRWLTSRALKPVFEGDYRSDPGAFKTVLLPSLLINRDRRRFFEIIKTEAKNDTMDKIPSQRIIPGEERILPSIPRWLLEVSVKSPSAMEVARKASFYALEEATREARDVLEGAYLILLSRRSKRAEEYLCRRLCQ